MKHRKKPLFRPDFRPAPLDAQLVELEREIYWFEDAAAKGKIRENDLPSRRHCLRSAYYTVQQAYERELQAQQQGAARAAA